MTRESVGLERLHGADGIAFRRAATAGGGAVPGPAAQPLIGVLPGEGIGPQVVDCALQVLAAAGPVCPVRPIVEVGGAIGLESKGACGRELSAEVIDFCAGVFARGGAVLAGPGGGRFVYDLRQRFDLYVKFSPLNPQPELADVARLKPAAGRGVDIVVVRDNIAGVYQGRATATPAAGRPQAVRQEFSYSAEQVRRLITAGAALAAARSGGLAVVAKRGGMPAMTELWAGVAAEVAGAAGVRLSVVDADLCAYQLIQHPEIFDVVVTPNLIGDIFSDLGAVLLGSRGLAYSGNFSPRGDGVYQTNHGSAHDLAGTGRANPAGQMLALAMLLRESLGLHRAADRIETALRLVWRQGWRTADVASADSRVVGAQEFTRRVADLVAGGPCDPGGAP